MCHREIMKGQSSIWIGRPMYETMTIILVGHSNWDPEENVLVKDAMVSYDVFESKQSKEYVIIRSVSSLMGTLASGGNYAAVVLNVLGNFGANRA